MQKLSSLVESQPSQQQRPTYVLATRVDITPRQDPAQLFGHDGDRPVLAQMGFRPNHNNTSWERTVSDGGLDKYVLRVSAYPFSTSPDESGPRFEATVINPLIRDADRNEGQKHLETIRLNLSDQFEIGEQRSSQQEAVSTLSAEF